MRNWVKDGGLPELLHRAEYAIYAEATLAVLWELIPRICYRLCVGVSIL